MLNIAVIPSIEGKKKELIIKKLRIKIFYDALQQKFTLIKSKKLIYANTEMHAEIKSRMDKK